MPKFRIEYSVKRYYTLECYADSAESAFQFVVNRPNQTNAFFNWKIDYELERAFGQRAEYISHVIDPNTGNQLFPDNEGPINLTWSKADSEFIINTA